jgi:acetyl esterase
MLKQLAVLVLIGAVGGPALSQETKTFTYRKTKQGDLESVVHYPSGWKETDKRPGIVFFFGGGWTGGKVEQFEPQAKHLASRGIVAARADYRVKSRHGVTPKECVEDAKSAVRWMRQNAAKLGVDPDRIVAAGGSAGGHIAACTALTPDMDAEGEDAKVSSKPNALVLFNPVLRFSGIPQLMAMIGNDEALGKAISPTLHLKKDTPPTLILFGTADRLAPMGDEFMKKSKELGHRAELFTAVGQSHGFFNRPPWLEKTTQRMDEFLVSINYLEEKTAAGTYSQSRSDVAAAETIAWGRHVGGLQLGLSPQDGGNTTDRAVSDGKSVYLQVVLRNVGKSPVRLLASTHTCLLGEGGANALLVSRLVLKPKAGGGPFVLVYKGWNHLCLLDKRRPKSEQPQQTLNRSCDKTDIQLTPDDAKRMSTVLAPGETRISHVQFTPNDTASSWHLEKSATLPTGIFEVTAVLTVGQELSEWKGELTSAPLEVKIPQQAGK